MVLSKDIYNAAVQGAEEITTFSDQNNSKHIEGGLYEDNNSDMISKVPASFFEKVQTQRREELQAYARSRELDSFALEQLQVFLLACNIFISLVTMQSSRCALYRIAR